VRSADTTWTIHPTNAKLAAFLRRRGPRQASNCARRIALLRSHLITLFMRLLARGDHRPFPQPALLIAKIVARGPIRPNFNRCWPTWRTAASPPPGHHPTFSRAILFAWYLPAWSKTDRRDDRRLARTLDDYNPLTLVENRSKHATCSTLYSSFSPKAYARPGRILHPDWLAGTAQ